jgi:RND family efflux transporter MFP subunit
MRMKKAILIIGLTIMAVTVHAGKGEAQPKGDRGKKQPPPAQVVVSPVKTGMLAPHAEFTGSVYFSEVSDLSSEVSGRSDEVLFEEGDLVKEGQILLKINSDILEKRMEVIVANYEEARNEHEKAKVDLKRIENLFRQDAVAEQTFDDYRYKVTSLEKKSSSLKSGVDQLKVELEKKIIRAPFNGIIIRKFADRGEWLDPGVKVATIAKRSSYDIVVDVPDRIIALVRKGMEIEVFAGGKTFKGRVFAIIHMGDIATRTFPVKIRVNTKNPLMEGMEARASLPEGEKRKSFLVPRDAVISVFGTTAVFAVIDSKAQMIPVNIIGFSGLKAGVEGKGLEEDMLVVIKGNERLRPGQAVSVMDKKEKKKN